MGHVDLEEFISFPDHVISVNFRSRRYGCEDCGSSGYIERWVDGEFRGLSCAGYGMNIHEVGTSSFVTLTGRMFATSQGLEEYSCFREVDHKSNERHNQLYYPSTIQSVHYISLSTEFIKFSHNWLADQIKTIDEAQLNSFGIDGKSKSCRSTYT